MLLFEEEERIVAKIADFGQSLQTHLGGSRNKHLNVNPVWLAPVHTRICSRLSLSCADPFFQEVLREGLYTTKSDVYAFGIVLWEIRTQDFPFKDFTFRAALSNDIENGNPSTPPPPSGAAVY